jgi:hypothetical protein
MYFHIHRLYADQSQAGFLWRLLPELGLSSDKVNDLAKYLRWIWIYISISEESTIKYFVKYLRWVIICVSGGLFGLSVFITVQVARIQHREAMLKHGLISFASEFLGLSILYVCLVWYTRREGVKSSQSYQLGLAFVTAVLGCLSASILLFLEPGHRISWVLALWVSTPSNTANYVLANGNRYTLAQPSCGLSVL